MNVNRELILTFVFFLIFASISTGGSVTKHATERRRFRTFQPGPFNNAFTIWNSSTKQNVQLIGDIAKAARKFFSEAAKVNEDEVKVSSFHTSKHNGVTHVYFQQHLNGIPVVNAFGNMNILKNGQVHSVGNSFYPGERPGPDKLRPKYSATNAIKALANLFEIHEELKLVELPLKLHSVKEETIVKGVTFAQADIQTELNYLQTKNGLRLVRKLMVDMTHNYYEACVDTDSNMVLSLIDYIADASYNVIPLGVMDINVGDQRIVTDPENPVASPQGWHMSGREQYTDTIGNNVIAQDNIGGTGEYHSNFRPTGERGTDNELHFNYKFDKTKHPRESVEASVTQIFYMNNIIHDIFYQYGFDEQAGNFQEYNYDLGGDGGDGVIANTLDGSDTNNAMFGTLPDGMNGRMYMFVFDVNPEGDPNLVNRDSTFDNGIVLHEYLHGISNRLTGGRLVTSCLPGGESGGMGEGWGDIFGVMFMSNNQTTRDAVFHMGTYVLAQNTGVRNFPYATNFKDNPSTYAFTALPNYRGVHAKGEVWAAILNEVYWNLVEKHGFQDDWYITEPKDAPNGRLGGNVIFTQLLIDGMKFQPCLPNFIQARDAIIAADKINNDGDNYNELWRGFAKRGLGVHAVFPGIENFGLPKDVPPTP